MGIRLLLKPSVGHPGLVDAVVTIMGTWINAVGNEVASLIETSPPDTTLILSVPDKPIAMDRFSQ